MSIRIKDEIQPSRSAIRARNISALKDFKSWVTANSVYRMWLNSMIEQANAFVRGSVIATARKG